MDSVTEARRAKFEAAYREKYNPCMPLGWCDDMKTYLYSHANGAWFGYNAALDSLAIELPSHEQYFEDEACCAINDCRQAIEKAGVKVK